MKKEAGDEDESEEENNAHMVYSPFATQEAPQEVKEQKRNEEERRQKVNLRLSAHLPN